MRYKKALRNRDWALASEIRREMMLDREEQIRGRKAGKGGREIFALRDTPGSNWTLGGDLETFVSKKMPLFGQRSPPHPGWGATSQKPLNDESSNIFQNPSWPDYLSALKHFGKNKGVRKGDIPGFVVANGSPWLQKFCFRVVVWMWANPEKVPKRWWADQVRFIPKEGRDSSLLSGWRPIAVGGFFYGLMMRIWTKKLECAADRCGWLCDEQYGFRRGRSSRGAAAMIRLLVDSSDSHVCVVRGDIERAFPSIFPLDVSHMLSSLGVPPSFLQILDELYKGVESVGVVNGKPGGISGRCRWPVQGLRQGCPASPLLMALWVNNAIQDIKNKGFQCVTYADDIWIVCSQDAQDEAKRCMQSSFAGAGLTINPLKVKVWMRSCSEPLDVLGMVLFDGCSVSASDHVLQRTRSLLSGGREKDFSCFKRVMYVNTVCLPSLRYSISALLLSNSKELISSIDRMLRNFVRGNEWPSNTPIDFLSDTQVGLSLLSLRTESLRDLVSFVWGLCRGRESDALRDRFLQAWRDRTTRRCRSLSLLEDWIDCVDSIDGKSFFDWNDEERELPPSLWSDSVFPFGSRGSYFRNSLQKWTSATRPPPPCCCNVNCFTNPCPILASARANSDPVVWVTDAGKIGTRSRKGLFAATLEVIETPKLVVSRFKSPVLETGCSRILREFCVSFSLSSSFLCPPPFLFFPRTALPRASSLPPVSSTSSSAPASAASSSLSPSTSSSPASSPSSSVSSDPASCQSPDPSPPLLPLSSGSSPSSPLSSVPSVCVARSLLILCPRVAANPCSPFLRELARVRRDGGLSVTVHHVKNTAIWGFRLAKDRAILSGRALLSSLSPPSNEWKKEVCGSPECCTSRCSIYLDAIKKDDLILWTDASFLPESRRCAAAFGWESNDGLHVTAFRVRGSAARGEVLAIFAALQFVEHSFPDRDISIFSDCEAAVSKVSSLSLCSPPFEVLSSIHRCILGVTKRLSERGRKLRLHWVKAHSSITQNDMIDAAAKKEALNFRRETLFEEKPLLPGEFTLKGQLVDNRQEIESEEWRPDLDKSIMHAARSYHARKIFVGVQQWRGLKSNWATQVKGECVYCHEKHSIAFGLFLQKCRRCHGFRKHIETLWKDVTWDDELLEGRVSHGVIRELAEKRGESKEEVSREARARVRKWEKTIDALCKELRGRGQE